MLLESLRKKYSDEGIDQLTSDPDPYIQFQFWYSQAIDSGIAEPNAFSLGSVSSDSKPSQRTVLMKSFDNEGFVFYTNHGSRKGKQMTENNQVSMLFPWYELHRQVNIEGTVSRIDDKRSFEYFRSRPEGSRIGAWASRQSQELDSRAILKKQIKEIEQKFKGQEIPLPPFWGGYLIRPKRFEFWQGRTHRLHDRIVYADQHGQWVKSRLSP